MTIRFLDYELDTDRVELRKENQVVAIEPQVYSVLAYLVEHRERVVSKEELLDNVWGDRFVSESALTSRISSARSAVGDDGRTQRVIKTVHGRGFRFVAEIDDGASGLSAAAHGADTGVQIEALAAGSGFALAVTGPRGSGKTALLERAVNEARRAGIAAVVSSASMRNARPYVGLTDAIDQLCQLKPELLDAIPAACAAELTACFGGAMPSSEARLGLAVRELLVAADGDPLLLAVDELDYANDGCVRLLANIARTSRDQAIGLIVAAESTRALSDGFDRRELEAPETVESRVAPKHLLDGLTRLAAVGDRFDQRLIEAAIGRSGPDLDRFLGDAVVEGSLEAVGAEYRFSDRVQVERLIVDLPSSALLRIRSEVGAALIELDGPPEQIGSLLIAAGAPADASPFALEAAKQALDRFAYLDVQHWVDDTIEHAPPEVALELRIAEADALAGAADPRAVSSYRSAIDLAPEDLHNVLRAKLARASILSGDMAAADETISLLVLDGGPVDGPIHLVRGMLAYYRAEFEAASDHADRAFEAAMKPGSVLSLSDAIAFQGMMSHVTGAWFDRLHREIRANPDGGEHLASLIDAHLCIAEYMLYGPMPYDEVIQMADALRTTAERAGAKMAIAFAAALSGEAALLAGDLDGARSSLEESYELHHDLGATTGEAHTLQRLAELELALGNPTEARRLGRRALAIGRWSTMAHHLVQRSYGTILAASTDPVDALDIANEALESVDDTTSCPPCDVMIYIPLASTFAENGELEKAEDALRKARISAGFWRGSAWPAAIAESAACISVARGDRDEAIRQMTKAVELFDEAGQALDTARCREVLEEMTTT